MDDAAVLKRRAYIMGINLGEGSYAKVKSAYSERLKFNVAVKIIHRKKAPTDFLEKFLPREIEILAMLNHRSIIKTYEIFETSDGKVYIVMELGVQGDLLEFIKTRGALQEDDARKKFHQLSSAIKYCHDLDVVHRDLKCENLLLDKDFNIKLSDCGFSKRCQPKVYDIWSLGVILYIMVCGSMPYDDSNIKKMLRIQKEHRVNFPRSKHLAVRGHRLLFRSACALDTRAPVGLAPEVLLGLVSWPPGHSPWAPVLLADRPLSPCPPLQASSGAATST
ncbi:hypothetical protein FD755_002476 [Muntiacus reevesi]|uniref:non-specific serine/threonine protein kinase n=1 Tax=Muntiacus reevesi TaxID=9886 RepID=A0A5J5NA11_MUNRE|nr:hypothetical protein FD755_002476 [Muntiacus reevesi]